MTHELACSQRLDFVAQSRPNVATTMQNHLKTRCETPAEKTRNVFLIFLHHFWYLLPLTKKRPALTPPGLAWSRPRAAQEPPTTAQESPKSRPEPPKSSPEPPKSAQSCPRPARSRPKNCFEPPAQSLPRAAQSHPRGTHGHPRTAQIRTRTAQSRLSQSRPDPQGEAHTKQLSPAQNKRTTVLPIDISLGWRSDAEPLEFGQFLSGAMTEFSGPIPYPPKLMNFFFRVDLLGLKRALQTRQTQSYAKLSRSPRWPSCGQDPTNPTRQPKTAQDRPRWPKKSPRQAQDGPRLAQNGPPNLKT